MIDLIIRRQYEPHTRALLKASPGRKFCLGVLQHCFAARWYQEMYRWLASSSLVSKLYSGCSTVSIYLDVRRYDNAITRPKPWLRLSGKEEANAQRTEPLVPPRGMSVHRPAAATENVSNGTFAIVPGHPVGISDSGTTKRCRNTRAKALAAHTCPSRSTQ